MRTSEVLHVFWYRIHILGSLITSNVRLSNLGVSCETVRDSDFRYESILGHRSFLLYINIYIHIYIYI